MEHYLGVAEESGIPSSEIGAAEAIVMAVAAGKVRAQFRDARRRRGTAGCHPERPGSGTCSSSWADSGEEKGPRC